MVWPEIEQRKGIQAVQGNEYDIDRSVVEDNPLVAFAYEAHLLHRPSPYNQRGDEQYNVFPYSLPVRQFDRITEASAVADGVCYGQPYCEQCKP